MTVQQKPGTVPMAALQPKHRKFAREVAKGRAPEEVVRELYPKDDVAIALRRVQTPKVLRLLGNLVSARWEKTLLLSRLAGIVADDRTKQGERITALRLGAQIAGHMNKVAAHKPKPSGQQMKNETDAETDERLARLVKQARESKP